MAPLKYEEQLKDKLEKRMLQPSEDAWEKLSNRLDNENAKSRKPYWLLGVAASIVGILFIVSQFLNDEIIVEDGIEIVTTPEIQVNQEQQEITEIASEDKEQESIKPVEDAINEFIEVETVEKKEVKKLLNPNKLNETNVAFSKENNDVTVKVTESKTSEMPKPILTFEEQKIQDVVAQVQALKEQNNEVTDADIDALLQQAQKEIKLNRLINESTGVVDADALLQDVEADIAQSFRSRVFEAIKASYNSVKTAVAQRND